MEHVLEGEGRVWVRKALNDADLNTLAESSNLDCTAGSRLKWSSLSIEAASVLNKVDGIANQIIPNAKSVRLVSFNKTSKTNWALPWHQDRVIAVENKTKVIGFGNWSQKAGIWHCEPPIEILDKMVFARIHIDDSDEMNGCLEVVLGSHKYGKILSEDMQQVVAKLNSEACIAKRGDILFVKALTVHRSHPSRSISSRQAMRVDYSNQILPSPLSWNTK